MLSSFKIGRIAGIDIGVHYTWVIAFALITWSLASGFFPAFYPGWEITTYWLTGAAAALALFASVLVHELSHSLVALRRGQQVHSITLFIFGGVANIEGELESAKDEFLIAIVGPITSFVLAGLFWLIGQAVGVGNTPVAAFLGYLALINLLLGGFNLVPGFPLDGGRVLRAIIWGVTGSMRRATQIASYVGQGFGFLLIFWGVSQLLAGQFLGGLWIAFIGWFLNNAAEQARQQQTIQENLRGVKIADVMNTRPEGASPALTVQEFMIDHALRQGQRALLIMDGERLAGIVTVTDAKEIAQEGWSSTPVSAIMTSAPLKTVSPDADLSSALQQMVEGDLNQMPVVQNERVVGMLSRADIMRFLRFRDEWGMQRAPGRRSAPARLEATR